MARARGAAEIIFPRTGGITLSRSIRATGSGIGIAVGITSGTGIIADSSTARGSFSTSGFIRGGHTGIRTTTTLTIITAIRTVTTPAITIQALTKTKSTMVKTATATSMRTQPLLPSNSGSQTKVIIADKLTALTVRKHGEPWRAIKATTGCVRPAL